MDDLKDNIDNIKQNINTICKRIGKNPDDITLIAVTKTVDSERINRAIGFGIENIGENKVQEIMSKYENIDSRVKWHLIGHLQTNKVKYIIDKVTLIHSLDSTGLAREISKRAENAGLVMDVLVQVNVAKEETKFGIDYEDIDDFIKEVSQYKGIKVKGLMTIAPYSEEPEEIRPVFRKLKEKFDMLGGACIPNVDMKYLSMGMTNDYSIAIEEGSNMVRIGTGIFGKRNYNI